MPARTTPRVSRAVATGRSTKRFEMFTGAQPQLGGRQNDYVALFRSATFWGPASLGKMDTFRPGFRLYWPSVTTVSPALNPDVMTVVSPATRATVTGRWAKVMSGCTR